MLGEPSHKNYSLSSRGQWNGGTHASTDEDSYDHVRRYIMLDGNTVEPTYKGHSYNECSLITNLNGVTVKTYIISMAIFLSYNEQKRARDSVIMNEYAL